MVEERELNIEELRQILHDEKMAIIVAETERKNKEIEKREAEDRELFGLRYHWTGQKATVTDVARDINPTRSKVLDLTESYDRTVNAHALGYLHAMYLRIGFVALLVLIYAS